MQITIKRNITQELECFKIKINLMTKGIRVAGLLFIIGVIIIVVCRNDVGVTDTSMMIYLFFELILFMTSFLIFKNLYTKNKIYKAFFKSAPLEYGNLETYSTVTIDEDYFVFESLRKYYKLSWSSLSMYQLYKGNLVLIIDNYNNSFIIRPNELMSSEFNALV
jgi:hypothetical protein